MLVMNLIKPTGATVVSLQMKSENGGHQNNIYKKQLSNDKVQIEHTLRWLQE